jgi:hypothetical protein
MTNPSQCAVLVPVCGSMEPETEQALRALADRGYPVRILRGSSQIDLARAMLATGALRDGFAETLWVDADVVFEPDDVERLRSHNRPFTAGLYPKKGPKEFTGKFRRPGQITLGAGGGLLEMQYVGMGFTRIHAAVYEAIKTEFRMRDCGGGYDGQRITPYFLPLLAAEGADLCYLSEDYSFCARARQAGFPPLADTTIKLGHVGRHIYTWDGFVAAQAFESLQLQVDDEPRIGIATRHGGTPPPSAASMVGCVRGTR